MSEPEQSPPIPSGIRPCASARRRGRTTLSVLLAMALGVLLGGATLAAADPDAAGSANRQFVQAMQIIHKADATYEAAEEGRLLREADRLLTEIIDRFPESPLAVQLTTNQIVGDFDIFEFRTRIRALICNDPLTSLCFLQRISGILAPVEMPIATARWDWLSMAVALHHLGDPTRAREIIAPFLSAVRRGGPFDSAEQDLFASRALALTGQTALALDLTRQIADCSTRVYNLTDITEALSWRGDRDQAIAIADEARKYAQAHRCNKELGLVAQALLRAGRDAEARTVFQSTVEQQYSRSREARKECCSPELAIAAAELGDVNLALNILRAVQDAHPWTVPAALGRLARRGENSLLLTYADEIQDVDNRAEAYAEMIDAALKRNDRPGAEDLMKRLSRLAEGDSSRRPTTLAQRARAEKLLHGDERWRSTFQQAVTAAEHSSNYARRDMGAPLLAALVRIETGLPMLD